ncbi:hypothetical protein AVEN_169224-1 [Araneus ventricosus]|uniref:Uncharacterized protein n=1 Tax=Araneus ventricosus TaxID=182803 RepID=A0A4Y2KC24_ARAVE|nr:hypothetical protein AVEN_169224-1 [Araneus ventricosus]
MFAVCRGFIFCVLEIGIMARTRNHVQCPIIGSPKEFSCIVLPTRGDILQHYNWIKIQKERSGIYKPQVIEIYEDIVIKIEEICFKKLLQGRQKNETLEKACFGKFQLDRLKPSEILGEENVKVCNNDVTIDKNTPSCSTPQRRLKLTTFVKTCNKYAVADRPTATLASPLLHDLGHCSPSLANKNPGKLSHASGSQLPINYFDFT